MKEVDQELKRKGELFTVYSYKSYVIINCKSPPQRSLLLAEEIEIQNF
jgi:hypothetical protein